MVINQAQMMRSTTVHFKAWKFFASAMPTPMMSADQRSALRQKQNGLVFQTFNLVPYLTAQENVQVPLVLAGVGEREQRRRAEALLGRVGLADRLDHEPRELSVGQQQRAALVCTPANHPAVILADEPTGNLDPETAESIMSFLGELNDEGRTIMMVTHDMRLAGRAKRSLRLVEGDWLGRRRRREIPGTI